jgi:hypothetical protein
MSKLVSLNEIELETMVNPSDSEDCKYTQKSQKYWSMLVVKHNLWINYLTKENLKEFKSNPNKRWKVIELTAKNGASYYWLDGLEKSYEIKEEV